MQALGAGVNRRQRAFDRDRTGLLQQLVLGVIHLETGASAARLAEAAQPVGALEAALLCDAEVKEPQRHQSARIAQRAGETAPSAKLDPCAKHLPFHHRLHAGSQLVERGNAGAILVAQGQMKQQVGDIANPECAELLRQPWTDAAQRRHGHLFGREALR